MKVVAALGVVAVVVLGVKVVQVVVVGSSSSTTTITTHLADAGSMQARLFVRCIGSRRAASFAAAAASSPHFCQTLPTLSPPQEGPARAGVAPVRRSNAVLRTACSH